MVLAGIRERWRPLRADLLARVVLLDISDPHLIIGQMLRGGQPMAPVWSAPVPAQTCRQGVPIALDALGDFIGDLLLEHGASDAGLVVALPKVASHLRLLEWPGARVPADPLEDLRQRGQDLGWPFRLADAVVDVQPLSGSSRCAIAGGVSREALDSWIEVFEIAGARLRHLIPAHACLQTALSDNLISGDSQALVALLHPSTTDCHLMVWRHGLPEFERVLPLEQEALIPELTHALAFCRSRLGGSPRQLLLGDRLEAAAAIGGALGLPREPVDRNDYGSLHLQGLGLLELAR